MPRNPHLTAHGLCRHLQALWTLLLGLLLLSGGILVLAGSDPGDAPQATVERSAPVQGTLHASAAPRTR